MRLLTLLAVIVLILVSQMVTPSTVDAQTCITPHEYQAGDANADHSIDLTDLTMVLLYICDSVRGVIDPSTPLADCPFSVSDIVWNDSIPCRMSDPVQRALVEAYGDANGDCVIDEEDLVSLVDYIFCGGPAPVSNWFGLSVTSITYTHRFGASTPPATRLVLLDAPSQVPWTLSTNEPWLHINSTNGMGSDSLLISVDITGLPVGVYRGTIIAVAIASNFTDTIRYPVRLNVQPTMVVIPSRFDFAYQRGRDDGILWYPLSVSSEYGSPLQWSFSKKAGWLLVDEIYGHTPETTWVSADSSVAVGNYSDTIVVTGVDTATQYQEIIRVPVTLAVSEAPSFSVVPGTLSFEHLIGEPAPPNQTLYLGGSAGVTWSLPGIPSWLTVSSGSGSVPDSVRINLSAFGLDSLLPGSYQDSLLFIGEDTVNAFQEIRIVRVSLFVQEPQEFDISPQSVSFACRMAEGQPPSQRVFLNGTPGLPWRLDVTDPDVMNWALLSKHNGVLPDTIDVSVVGCELYGMEQWFYGEIQIVAGDTLAPLADTLFLTWHVEQGVLFDAWPATLNFSYVSGGGLPSQTITIGSPAWVGMPWCLSLDAPYLTVDKSCGVLPADSFVVTVRDSGLVPGQVYRDSIVLVAGDTTSEGGRRVVRINLNVYPRPSASADRLGFLYEKGGALPPSRQILLDGPPILHWTAAKAAPWLLISPSSGSFPAVVEATLIGVDSLPEGIYAGSVSFTSEGNGSDTFYQEVDVSLHIQPAVEVGSNLTPPGAQDSLPIYISHDTLAGFFIPLSYGNSSQLFRRPDASDIRMDSIRIAPYYLGFGTEAIIDSVNQLAIIRCPIKRPPIPPPDTSKSTLLAMAYYTVQPDARPQIIRIDTTSTVCPEYDVTTDTTCGIRYYLPDGSVIIPQFEPGVIFIGTLDTTVGQLIVSTDTVALRQTAAGDSVCLSLMNIADRPIEFAISGLTCYSASPLSGTTPAEIWVRNNDCSQPEVMRITSPQSIVPCSLVVNLESESDSSIIIVLKEGWNLVSWNLQTPSAAITSVLGPHIGCIDVVLGFRNGGQTFDPQLAGFSTLRIVDPLSGYWIKMKPGCQATMRLTGSLVPSATPIDLVGGWNLVGYLPQDSMPPAVALASLSGNLISTYGFDDVIRIYDPRRPVFSNLTQMKRGCGYWLRVSGAGVLTYPGGVSPRLTPQNGGGMTAPAENDVIATRRWISLYGQRTMLDGQLVLSGSTIEAISVASGARVGRGYASADGRFGFLPVYADDDAGVDTADLKPGAEFYLAVNGVVTRERFVWTQIGDRIEVTELNRVVGTTPRLPETYRLYQNYPNPFNASTVISFDVPRSGRVVLSVYDVLGKRVATVADAEYEAGHYQVTWEAKTDAGSSLASGMYLIRLDAGEFTSSSKMLLLK